MVAPRRFRHGGLAAWKACLLLIAALAFASSHGQGAPATFGAIETGNPRVGVLMITPSGDLVGVVTEREGFGGPFRVEGLVFWGVDGTRVSVVLGEDGLPAFAVAGYALMEYERYGIDAVDLSITSPDGSEPQRIRASLDPEWLALARRISAESEGARPGDRSEIMVAAAVGDVVLRSSVAVVGAAGTYLGVSTCFALLPEAFLIGAGTLLMVSTAGACASAVASVVNSYEQFRDLLGELTADASEEQAERLLGELRDTLNPLLTAASVGGDTTAYLVGIRDVVAASDLAGGVGVTVLGVLTSELEDLYEADLAHAEFLKNLGLQERIRIEQEAERFDRDQVFGPEDRCPWRPGTIASRGCPTLDEGIWQATWRGAACRGFDEVALAVTDAPFLTSGGSQLLNLDVRDGAFETALSDLSPHPGRIAWRLETDVRAVGTVTDARGELLCFAVFDKVGDMDPLDLSDFALVEQQHLFGGCPGREDMVTSSTPDSITFEWVSGPEEGKFVTFSWDKPYFEDERIKIAYRVVDASFDSPPGFSLAIRVNNSARLPPVSARQGWQREGAVAVPANLDRYEIEAVWSTNSPFGYGCGVETSTVAHLFVLERP